MLKNMNKTTKNNMITYLMGNRSLRSNPGTCYKWKPV